MRYLLYKFFTSLWFLGAVWIYFYRLYINDAQIGLVDSLGFLIGLLFEIPSGAIADRIGKKKMIIIGYILISFGFLLQITWIELTGFIIGQSIAMIGISCVSGTDDALFYEATRGDRDEDSWKKLVTRGIQVHLFAVALAVLVGGWMHTIDPRLPWLATAIAFLVCIVFLWGVPETRLHSEKKTLFDELGSLASSMWSGCIMFLRTKIIYYIPIIIGLQGIFYAYDYGLLRLVLMDRFGFDPLAGSIALTSIIVITLLCLEWLHRHIAKLTESVVFFWIAGLTIVSLIVSIFDIGYFGYIVLFVFYLGDKFVYPFINNGIQKSVSDSQRATMLSIASSLRAIPYIFLAIVIGYMNDRGALSYLLFAWSISILILMYVYYILANKTKKRLF